MADREIKFRVWDGKRMWTFDENDHEYRGPLFIFTGTGGIAEVQVAYNTHALGVPLKLKERLDCTALQSTGLKDADGTEIYEGDVVDIEHAGYGQRGVVRWDSETAAFDTEAVEDVFIEEAYTLRVTGNIYEHPDLANETITPQTS